MNKLRRGLVVIVLAGVTALLVPPAAQATPPVANPASPSKSAWSVEPAAPRFPTGSLSGVSCETADSCIAVGSRVNAAGADATLTELWIGTVWEIEKAPAPPGSTFTGISCASSTFCMALGNRGGTSGLSGFAETWDGQVWAASRIRNPTNDTQLTGISCSSRSFCVAVGYYDGADDDQHALTSLEWEDLGGPAGQGPGGLELRPVRSVMLLTLGLHGRGEHQPVASACRVLERHQVGDDGDTQPVGLEWLNSVGDLVRFSLLVCCSWGGFLQGSRANAGGVSGWQ